MNGLDALLAPERIVTFVLVVARLVGLMLIAPIFGSRMIPVRVRAAFVFFLAVAMLPARATMTAPAVDAESPVALLLAISGEVAIGFLLGLVAQFAFSAVQVAGELAGVQMGFGLAGLIDPQSHDRVMILAQWQNLVALLLFLAVDGHHLLIRAVAESFRRIPAGSAALSAASIGLALSFAAQIFVLALKIAAPVLVLVLMVNGVLGSLAKLIPQLNVMVVGFPINVAAGLFVLAAAQPFALRLLENAFGDVASILGTLIDNLA